MKKMKNGRIPEELAERVERGLFPRKKNRTVQDVLKNFDAEKLIGKSTRIGTIGSCFAVEVRKWLDSNGYNTVPSKWGIMYTPQNIAQVFSFAADIGMQSADIFSEMAEPIWHHNGKYCDPYRKSLSESGPWYLGDTEEEAMAKQRKNYTAIYNKMKATDVMVITLGLIEGFVSDDGWMFYAMPHQSTYKPAEHRMKRLSVAQVVEELQNIELAWERVNPDVKIIYSVSPVPLSLTMREGVSPVIANTLSKSTLYAALAEHLQHSRVGHYMPSYDIAMSDQKKFFKDDGRHVNERCVGTIMKAFAELFVE